MKHKCKSSAPNLFPGISSTHMASWMFSQNILCAHVFFFLSSTPALWSPGALFSANGISSHSSTVQKARHSPQFLPFSLPPCPDLATLQISPDVSTGLYGNVSILIPASPILYRSCLTYTIAQPLVPQRPLGGPSRLFSNFSQSVPFKTQISQSFNLSLFLPHHPPYQTHMPLA